MWKLSKWLCQKYKKMKSVDSVRIKNDDLKENFSLDVGVILKHFLKELVNDTETHSIF